jgi:hypothetical protein
MFFGVKIPHPTPHPEKNYGKRKERGLYIVEFSSIKSAKRKGKKKHYCST